MKCSSAESRGIHTKDVDVVVFFLRQNCKTFLSAKGRIDGDGEIRQALHGHQLTHISVVDIVVVG